MFSVIHHYHFDAKNGAEKPSLYDRLGGGCIGSNC